MVDYYLYVRIEPHRPLLNSLPEGRDLYKIIKIENFLDMLREDYFYFNRVDSYSDDKKDGKQLQLDEPNNSKSKFLKNPSRTAADWYDVMRKRSYACCFSTENSDYLWKEYGNNGEDCICIRIKYGKLRKFINETLLGRNNLIISEELPLIKGSINYGLINYVDTRNHQLSTSHLPNHIEYIYLKNKKYFEKEKEFRISITIDVDGKILGPTPAFLKIPFNFKKAYRGKIIEEILISSNCNPTLKQSLIKAHKNIGILCSGTALKPITFPANRKKFLKILRETAKNLLKTFNYHLKDLKYFIHLK